MKVQRNNVPLFFCSSTSLTAVFCSSSDYLFPARKKFKGKQTRQLWSQVIIWAKRPHFFDTVFCHCCNQNKIAGDDRESLQTRGRKRSVRPSNQGVCAVDVSEGECESHCGTAAARDFTARMSLPLMGPQCRVIGTLIALRRQTSRPGELAAAVG